MVFKGESLKNYILDFKDEKLVRVELPNVEERKVGKWITKIKSDLRGDMWPTNPKCSECGGEPYYSNNISNYKFCPYCGAEMESEDNGND